MLNSAVRLGLCRLVHGFCVATASLSLSSLSMRLKRIEDLVARLPFIPTALVYLLSALGCRCPMVTVVAAMPSPRHTRGLPSFLMSTTMPFLERPIIFILHGNSERPLRSLRHASGILVTVFSMILPAMPSNWPKAHLVLGIAALANRRMQCTYILRATFPGPTSHLLILGALCTFSTPAFPSCREWRRHAAKFLPRRRLHSFLLLLLASITTALPHRLGVGAQCRIRPQFDVSQAARARVLLCAFTSSTVVTIVNRSAVAFYVATVPVTAASTVITLIFSAIAPAITSTATSTMTATAINRSHYRVGNATVVAPIVTCMLLI